MSNFKQIDHKIKTGPTKTLKIPKNHHKVLGDILHHREMVEIFNHLIKEIFVCHSCGKNITSPRWLLVEDPKHPKNISKTRFYHSKARCNPIFVGNCLYCSIVFRRKRKNQQYCSKKCAISYMNSPILIKTCSSCGKGFKSRMIPNKPNNESRCSSCK